MTTNDEAQAVLDFWLDEDGIERGWPTQDLSKRWFGGGAALDTEIEARFGALVRDAVAGGLGDWEQAGPLSRLALVIVLDQFTRHVFRGRADAFTGDARAQALVLDALEHGIDKQLPRVGRVFLLMPLMHAENLELQRRCVREFEALVANTREEAVRREIEGNLRFAKSHLEIIERFGRFPYRNAALGRASSDAELEFLKDGPRYGQ